MKNSKINLLCILQLYFLIQSVFGLKKLKKSTSFKQYLYLILIVIIHSIFFVDVQINRIEQSGEFAIIDVSTLGFNIFACFSFTFLSTVFCPEWIGKFFQNIEDLDNILWINKKKVYSNLRKRIITLAVLYCAVNAIIIFYDYILWGMTPSMYLWYYAGTTFDLSNIELMIYVTVLSKHIQKLKILIKNNYVLEYNKNRENIAEVFGPSLKTITKFEIESKYLIFRLMIAYDKLIDCIHILNISFGLVVWLKIFFYKISYFHNGIFFLDLIHIVFMFCKCFNYY